MNTNSLAWGLKRLVDYLPNMQKALDLLFSKHKPGVVVMYSCNVNMWWVETEESEVHSYPQL